MGMASSLIIRHLKDFNRMHRPKIICLMKTQNEDAFRERIREQVGMDSAYYVKLKGISRGITLWWRDDVSVTLKATTQNITDCEVKMIDHPNSTLLTWVYADVDLRKRKQYWIELRDSRRGRIVAWACMVVFNEISHHHKKEGANENLNDKWMSIMR